MRKEESALSWSTLVRANQQGQGADNRDNGEDDDEANVFRFQKSYRVFNECQIEGLIDGFHPEPVLEHPSADPIPHMQTYFERIDIATVFTGNDVYYLPAMGKVFILSIAQFDNPRNRYLVRAHELGHATNISASAEFMLCFIEEEFGFTAHMLEMDAVELHNWRRLLPSEKNTIVLHATASQTDCGYLIARSEAGRAVHTEWGHDCSIVA